jgi:hypothetical protein
MMKFRNLTAIRYLYLLNALLGTVLIFSPIVWMEIGPRGIEYYGPTVPDIWVYGGALTGKDLSFEPLLIMMLFQFACIIIGIVLSLVCFFRWKKRAVAVACCAMIAILLGLFPVWIDGYISVIIGNSDGAAADLTVHWMYGLWIAIIIASSTILAIAFSTITYVMNRRALNKKDHLFV